MPCSLSAACDYALGLHSRYPCAKMRRGVRGICAGSHITSRLRSCLLSPLSARLSSVGAFALRLRYGAPTSLAALRLLVFAYGVPLVLLLWITTIASLRGSKDNFDKLHVSFDVSISFIGLFSVLYPIYNLLLIKNKRTFANALFFILFQFRVYLFAAFFNPVLAK